jgi:hypothetical protein
MRWASAIAFVAVMAAALYVLPESWSDHHEAAWTGSSQRQGGHTVVPRVVGLPQTVAECRLAHAGLRWRVGPGQVEDKPVISCQGGVAVRPDPIVRRQFPKSRLRLLRSRVVTLETDCSLLRFQAGGPRCA